MGNLVIGGGVAKSGTSIQIGGSSSVVPTAQSQPASTSLSTSFADIRKTAEEVIAFKAKPVLIYLIVDLTASRSQTRSSMQKYERDLAQKIRSVGGEHPVICKGVYHRGGSSSEPMILNDAKAIESFLDTSPIGGETDIAPGLRYYLNDKTESDVSLGILIGDSDDGDSASNLKSIAAQLKIKNRPLIVAYENTGDDDFCRNTAPALASASEGLCFQLSSHPEELNILLANLRKVLETTPDQLKKQASNPQSFNFSGTDATRRFASKMAETLLLAAPK
jgi:hypothetical protein